GRCARAGGEPPGRPMPAARPAALRSFNAFNLLVVDAAGARVLTHLGDGRILGPTTLAAGLHVIVNAPFRHGDSARALVESAPPGFALLTSHGRGTDDGLCHHGVAYGTVSSTVVALDRALRLTRYLYR